MPIKIYNVEQSIEWDNVVKSFSDYDVYYLSGYVKAFQINGDGEPILFYYEDENNRGINVIMRRDISDDERFSNIIAQNQYFDFVTPYGYGGWLIEGNGSANKLFDTYAQWCRENNIVSEFVRYHPMLNNSNYSREHYEVVDLGKTIAIDLSSPELIWENFTSKNRNMIRKAIKSGVKVYHGQYPSIYQTFRQIYNTTMDANDASDYYFFSEEFYNSILNDLKNESCVFWAELDGKIIAASIFIAANGFLNYHLSGSLLEYRKYAPTNLLLYEAALWGNTNGYKSLHLGGGLGSHEDSLYEFKHSFNRNTTHQFSIGKKIFLADAYKKLVEVRKLTSSSGFFPEYRDK